MNWTDYIFGAFFVLLLFAFAWNIAQAYRKAESLYLHGVRTQGVVVRNKVLWNREVTVRPVVRFNTQTGEVVEGVAYGRWAMIFPRFSKGEKVAILYDAQDPTNFKQL